MEAAVGIFEPEEPDHARDAECGSDDKSNEGKDFSDDHRPSSRFLRNRVMAKKPRKPKIS